MIITRTPLRVPLGGGGTDLPAYYTQYGGFLTSVAINKYVYIAVKRRFDEGLRVSYSKTEVVRHAAEVEHPIVREVLNLLKIDGGVEIVSIGDVPANTGLGGSGSFTVGLLHALHAFKRERRTPQELAEESFFVQADRLGEPIGKQDEYLAAFGGVTNLGIHHDGQVVVRPVVIPEGILQEFEHDLLLFYTGMQRQASDILRDQQQAVRKKQHAVSASMHHIKRIGQEITTALEQGDPRRVGELMHEHWVQKQQISSSMAPPDVRRWYDMGRQHGAVGGKLIGAGGGGFLLFYCDQDRAGLRRALTAEGLRELRFFFDYEGTKVLVNLEEQLWVSPTTAEIFQPQREGVGERVERPSVVSEAKA